MKLKSMVVVGFSFLLIPQIASAEILSVKGASANFRDKPTEGAKIKFSADKFYPVEVIEKKNGWVKVKDFEGDEAWVVERLLAKQPSIVISADKANVRASPNTSSDVVFKAERGEVFKIEERKNDWLKVVDARGDGGWIREDMTWGEPVVAAVKEKLEKADVKGDDKASAPSESKAKAASVELSKETVKVDAKPAAISEPKHLQMLCRAYLDEPPQVKIALDAPKTEKAEKKETKPAAKPASKPAAKPAPKPAAKPKPAQKK